MESIVLFVMAHGTTVITMLLGSIILCVFGLLLIGFHSPKELVMGELGAVDRIEGVLRRILSEQQFVPAGGSMTPEGVGVAAGTAMNDDQAALYRIQVEALEKEIQEKQSIIETLEKGGATVGDNSELLTLKQKVKDLEEKLSEYAVIEEDIADLSKYRQENEDLRQKISHVSGVPANDAVVMPWDEFEKAVKDKKVKSVKDKDNIDTTIQAADAETPPIPVDTTPQDIPTIVLNSDNKE
ncbi:MAG: hypothetical protein K2Q26_03045 [Bdellovibrionales bacterium]|nr:hypothetical protein [Bdellovibrionales bacterium]